MAREYEGRPPAKIELRRAHGEVEFQTSSADDRYVEEEDEELWGPPQISSTTLKLAKFKKGGAPRGPAF